MPATLHIILLCCMMMLHSSCKTQQTHLAEAIQEPTRDYLITGDFKLIAKDKLGKFYLVNSKNQLQKYNSEYNLEFSFSLYGLGNISTIDVSNPQKILVYFPQYQNIIFLDNTLSEIKRLNLQELGYWDVFGVALSRDNNIWIHDPINNRMLKINSAGDIQLSSNEQYTKLIEGKGPVSVFELENRLFLYYQNLIREYDNFGQELKSYMVENEGVRFTEGAMYFMVDNKIFRRSYTIQLAEESQNQMLYSGSNIRDFSIDAGKAWIIDNRGLFVHNF